MEITILSKLRESNIQEIENPKLLILAKKWSKFVSHTCTCTLSIQL